MNGKWHMIKPWPEESVRSWLIKNALFHGVKPSHLAYLASGNAEIYKSDLDVRFPPRLSAALIHVSDISIDELRSLPLSDKKDRLVPSGWQSKQLRWTLKIGIRSGNSLYGQQYCPLCWKEDLDDPGSIPWLRKWWRLAFFTACPWHGCKLRDRCPECGQPLGTFTNLNKRYGHAYDPRDIMHCTQCGFDMSNASIQRVEAWELEMNRAHMKLYQMNCGAIGNLQFDNALDYFSGLHVLLGFEMCDPHGRDFHDALCKELGINESHRFRGRQKEVELLPLDSRSQALHLVHHLLSDWPDRFASAISISHTKPHHVKRKWRSRRKRTHWLTRALETCAPKDRLIR